MRCLFEESILIVGIAGSGNLVQWLVNGSPMLVDLQYPTLQAVIDGNATFSGNTTFDERKHVFKVGEKHEVSRPPIPSVSTVLTQTYSGSTGSFNRPLPLHQ
jgi:hypothetical protein